MKGLNLSNEEKQTLREMGIHQPHARTRRRAQGVGMLGQGMTLQEAADEFEVHINSVEHWRQCWVRLGLAGLYEGRHSGRPPTLSPDDQREWRKLVAEEGGTSRSLLSQGCDRKRPHMSRDTLRRYLRQMGFRYKHCRLNLKEKRNDEEFERAQGTIASLRAMAQAGQCDYHISMRQVLARIPLFNMDGCAWDKRVVHGRDRMGSVSMFWGH